MERILLHKVRKLIRFRKWKIKIICRLENKMPTSATQTHEFSLLSFLNILSKLDELRSEAFGSEPI